MSWDFILCDAFGIFAARWRLFFLQPINADPDQVVIHTKAALCLHNLLWPKESSSHCPPGFGDYEGGNGTVVPGDWRQIVGENNLVPIGQKGGNSHSHNAAYRSLSILLLHKGRRSCLTIYDHLRSTGDDDV